ncbi:MAG: TPM domain-containing protein, partial [Gemmatimonadaceae bacterium]|nr:TPM domain-containing protein [Gemmatimonadaceae bacterium]
MRRPKTIGIIALLLALLRGSLVAAAPAAVVDEAGFFSPDAVARANQQLAQIRQQHGRDLRIETHRSIPQNLAGQFEPNRKAEFFTQWAYQSAKSAGVNGALVLITREPSYLQVVVGQNTRRLAFTPADRDRLRDAMLGSFKDKRYDEGLLQGIDIFRQSLASHGASASATPSATPTASAAPAAVGNRAQSEYPGAEPAGTARQRTGGGFSIGKLLFWGLLILLGIFIIRRMLGARRTAAQQQANSPMYGQQRPYGQPPPLDPNHNQPGYGSMGGGGMGGGGAFGRGLGGGLLGGLFGGWLGSRMFGQGGAAGNQALGSAPPPQDQAGGGVFSDQAHQQDFTADQGG